MCVLFDLFWVFNFWTDAEEKHILRHWPITRPYKCVSHVPRN